MAAEESDLQEHLGALLRWMISTNRVCSSRCLRTLLGWRGVEAS